MFWPVLFNFQNLAKKEAENENITHFFATRVSWAKIKTSARDNS